MTTGSTFGAAEPPGFGKSPWLFLERPDTEMGTLWLCQT